MAFEGVLKITTNTTAVAHISAWSTCEPSMRFQFGNRNSSRFGVLLMRAQRELIRSDHPHTHTPSHHNHRLSDTHTPNTPNTPNTPIDTHPHTQHTHTPNHHNHRLSHTPTITQSFVCDTLTRRRAVCVFHSVNQSQLPLCGRRHC